MTPFPVRTVPLLLAVALGPACRGTTTDVQEPDAPEAARVTAPADRPAPLEDPSFQQIPSRGGDYTLCWRPVAGRVPRNTNFELEVWLFAGETPVPGAELFVRGWMPDHAHGMLHVPRTVDQGDGSYRVSGMLLHMRGHWQLFFDIVVDGSADVAECELDL